MPAFRSTLSIARREELFSRLLMGEEDFCQFRDSLFLFFHLPFSKFVRSATRASCTSFSDDSRMPPRCSAAAEEEAPLGGVSEVSLRRLCCAVRGGSHWR